MGHASRLLWIKKLCPRALPAMAGIMAEIFRILLAESGKRSASTPNGAMDGTLLQAPTRSQKSATEGLDATRRTGAERRQIHLHVDGPGYSSGSDSQMFMTAA